MKTISLNVCGGALRAPLMEFIAQEAESTDIFCFQEVYKNDAGIVEREHARMNLFDEIAAALPGFAGQFAPVVAGQGPDTHEDLAIQGGSAIFVKSALHATCSSVFVVGTYNVLIPEGPEVNWPIVLQYAEIADAGKTLVVAHVHGLAYPGNKLDTPARLAQSEAIVRWVRLQKSPVALLGDFNLLPATKSISLITEAPLRNLIADYGITITRPMSHVLRYPENERQYFADYAFVSPQLTVKDFSVPDIEVSDHLPLVLQLV